MSLISRNPWPAPDDPGRPNEEELQVIEAMQDDIKRTEPELFKELERCYDKMSTLCSFARGYYFNQFKKEKPDDKLRLTVRILKRAMTWRRENDVHLLAGRTLPNKEAMSHAWATGITGFTNEGRPVVMMGVPDPKLTSNFTKEEFAW